MNQAILKAKQEIVSKITEGIKGANSIVVIEYRGLTVDEITEVRHALRATDSTLRVYKNSLVERACDELGHSELREILEGPNAIVFSKDTINGPKVIAKFAKKHENLVIKGGLVEGKMMNADQIKVIASLPGREGLISMFLSCLQAPIRNFACAVKAVAEKN